MNPATLTALWVIPLLLAWFWRPRQPMSPGAWMLLLAYGALGAWTLWFGFYGHRAEPAGFSFWKPTVLYWTIAAITLVSPALGWGYPAKILLGTYFALSNREWRWINRGFGIVYAIMGGVNLWVAAEVSYRNWSGFKFSCMMNLLIIVVFRLNFVWLPILADVFIHLYRRGSTAYRFLASRF